MEKPSRLPVGAHLGGNLAADAAVHPFSQRDLPKKKQKARGQRAKEGWGGKSWENGENLRGIGRQK